MINNNKKIITQKHNNINKYNNLYQYKITIKNKIIFYYSSCIIVLVFHNF